jgi:uncharacterized protein (DUF924 family)
MLAQDVLDFWFLPAGAPGHGELRVAWFKKDDAFDAAIGERFGHLIDIALAGGLREWEVEGDAAARARGTLARILVLDQFTRNAYRGQPKSFAGDALALAAAHSLVDSGAHQQLAPLERWFAYMPFEHAEDARMQEQSVQLFTELAKVDPRCAGAFDYALRHRGVIARFGRFPHRNVILGRSSSAEELAFLQQPGSGF